MKINEMQNGYVQPECNVYQVHIEQMIANSPGVGEIETPITTPED